MLGLIANWRKRWEQRRFLEPLRTVAARHGGELVEKRRHAYIRTPRFVLAMIADRGADLEPGVSHYVRFEAPLQSPQFLEVWPRGSRFTPLRLTLAQDLTLGAPDFEQYFVIRADDVGFARGVLSKPLRDRIYAIWSLSGGGLVRVDVYPHKLAVQKEVSMPIVYYVPFVDKCLDLLKEVAEAVHEQEGVEWLDAPKREEHTACPICGSPLEVARVTCLKCKMAHHRECWEWNGGCSMFACGESRFELA